MQDFIMNYKSHKTLMIHTILVLIIKMQSRCNYWMETTFHYRNGNKQWLEDFELIRGSRMGHLAFPVQKNSLNQLRGTLLKDRIDYALFDIKLFYANETNLKLQKAYDQEATRKWLKSFGSFNQFIDNMRLNYFVYKNPNTLEYKVIDLSIPYKCDLSHCLKDIPQKLKLIKLHYEYTSVY